MGAFTAGFRRQRRPSPRRTQAPPVTAARRRYPASSAGHRASDGHATDAATVAGATSSPVSPSRQPPGYRTLTALRTTACPSRARSVGLRVVLLELPPSL